MADHVGEIVGAGDAAEFGGVRARARRSSSSTEMIAPKSTPMSSPDPSTPSSAVSATAKSPRLKCQTLFQGGELNNPATATSTMAASTGCGR